MENKRWKSFIEYINSTLGIPITILNYIAVSDILLGCVTGLSNSTISKKYNCSDEYIVGVLNEFLDFKGWTNDLDINIYFMYNNADKNLNAFRLLVTTITPLINDKEINISYNICKKYDIIIKEVNKFYG